MAEIWRHTAKLYSGLLLISEEHEVNLQGSPGDSIKINFAKPVQLEVPTWSSWNYTIPNIMWEYAVTVEFEAEDEKEAQAMAWSKLESIAARLSFLGSAPVKIGSYGSLSNAPEVPEEGKRYTTIALATEAAAETGVIPTVSEEEASTLANVLVPEHLIPDGSERIERSMKWLQRSHFSQNPTDEFTSLMLAFEAISHLLNSPETRYWECPACNSEMRECPSCGSSTEWKGSSKEALEDFVCQKINWPISKWRKLWGTRNSVFHARHDLSILEQQEIAEQLPDLELAVVSALRYLLKLPNSAPPNKLRARVPFYGAILNIKWTR